MHARTQLLVGGNDVANWTILATGEEEHEVALSCNVLVRNASAASHYHSGCSGTRLVKAIITPKE